MVADIFNLGRFLKAQDSTHQRAVAELHSGNKRTHWMWYIFPQVAGLGLSQTSIHYAIRSLEEAIAYLEHPILGARLLECTGVVNAIEGKPIGNIFGSPDDLKFHSSMTLFSKAASSPSVFERALEKYFGSRLDPGTLERL